MNQPKRRERKDTDQQETQKAYNYLLEAIHNHPEIESTLWAGACMTLVANGFAVSGLTYQQFCDEMHYMIKVYAEWFEIDVEGCKG